MWIFSFCSSHSILPVFFIWLSSFGSLHSVLSILLVQRTVRVVWWKASGLARDGACLKSGIIDSDSELWARTREREERKCWKRKKLFGKQKTFIETLALRSHQFLGRYECLSDSGIFKLAVRLTIEWHFRLLNFAWRSFFIDISMRSSMRSFLWEIWWRNFVWSALLRRSCLESKLWMPLRMLLLLASNASRL